MVCPTLGFPRPGIEFRHVLNIAQQRKGLETCIEMLNSHTGDWEFSKIACCETGGFVFASSLALRIDEPLALIRELGKLPPPTVSISKLSAHISSSDYDHSTESWIVIEQSLIPTDASVLVMDDVLASGRTLYDIIRVLRKVGIGLENMCVVVVAKFPSHRGRQFFREQGLGGVRIRRLLDLMVRRE
ncbi:hypothetical protein N7532_003349 [Penicillium argentinense]|uniref:adenine phosphoribosyltransferase n=1 Tax=Penicillium argentinense TaxID=1131581 RepID=A0A9W9FMA1_9EURO|nr:uncharacterized protein N7532_003349 [Penicillium argentinense]KAJ5102820.1 hypothetical protein N7532_003349 [Penicillium argentinense]